MNELEQAAMELLKKRFTGIEEWPADRLRHMLVMAKRRIWRDRNGGQSVEAEGFED